MGHCVRIALPNPGNREWIVEETIRSTIVCKDNVHWKDVIGLDKEKRALREMLIHPFRETTSRHYPEGSPEKGILLFGLPGNGKTMLLNWIVPMLEHMTVFNVTLVDVFSRYQGESSDLMRQLFVEARRRRPSLICFDHVDFTLWELNEGTSECRREMLGVFLRETGAEADNRNIFLLGSTDMPWAMDNEAKMRFSKHMYVGQPNYQMRMTLFECFLTKVNGLGPNEFHTLARWTKGFTYDEVHQICYMAERVPQFELASANHFKPIGISARGRTIFVPCTKEAVGATPMRLLDVERLGELGPFRRVKKEDVFKCAKSANYYAKEPHLQKMESYAVKHDPTFHGHWEGAPIPEDNSNETNCYCTVV